MRAKRITPVLVVERIEPCVEFWTRYLGFEVTNSVPEGNRLGFVILSRDALEIMYQSVGSVAKDIPAAAVCREANPCTMLFLEVDDIDAIERMLKGVPLLMPRRKTFYGADEVVVEDPAGNTIIFAQLSG